MRKLLAVWWLLTSAAWAEVTLERPASVDASTLTTEAVEVVPTLTGLSVDTQTQPGITLVTFRRVTGEFTAAERAKLTNALKDHDAERRGKERAERGKQRQQAITKLQGLGLTEAEVTALTER